MPVEVENEGIKTVKYCLANHVHFFQVPVMSFAYDNTIFLNSILLEIAEANYFIPQPVS